MTRMLFPVLGVVALVLGLTACESTPSPSAPSQGNVPTVNLKCGGAACVN